MPSRRLGLRPTHAALLLLLAVAEALLARPASLRSTAPRHPHARHRAPSLFSPRMEPHHLPNAPLLQRALETTSRGANARLSEAAGGSFMASFRKASSAFCNLLPLWTVLTACIGLLKPQVFLCVSTKYFTGLIGILMLCMGITLSLDDFRRVLTRPAITLLGFVGCYGLLPALALAISKALALSPSLSAGLVLLSAINGAQASNLCNFIAKGDVALSVLMTTCQTVGAIVMTPLVAKVLLGTVVPVNAQAVALSTAQVVIVPISAGMAINANFPGFVERILPFAPVVGIIITCLLVGSAVAGSAAAILASGLTLQAACALLHFAGGAIGYMGVKSAKYTEKEARTFGIQLATKSSAFGYLLAKLHFADPLVRVPSAVSIVWMTLVGSTLAVISRFNPPAAEE
ncbi:hypothetical protein AB1Y20_002176 [Prymnesium parvum]|uniref:Uncharacterized protein n=1 Tax=Prymnesium parvum TaxID=97485 RepID=A0AB34JA86_PRYPA